MLYILGGASRSGKSIIARRLVADKQIPFFCTDYLITALQEGVPDVDIKHGQEFISKAEKLWPMIKPLMIKHLIEEGRNYLIEGDGILPKQASELLNDYPGNIKTCFVGFSEINPNDKFQQVRESARNKDDWTNYISDKKLLKNIKDMIEVSKYLKAECKKYNLCYFDSSKNFKGNIEKVLQYLAK